MVLWNEGGEPGDGKRGHSEEETLRVLREADARRKLHLWRSASEEHRTNPMSNIAHSPMRRRG